jgi:hypothetical protein
MLQPNREIWQYSPPQKAGKMWQLEKKFNTCFLVTKLLNFSEERKRKSWSGDGEHTLTHSVGPAN